MLILTIFNHTQILQSIFILSVILSLLLSPSISLTLYEFVYYHIFQLPTWKKQKKNNLLTNTNLYKWLRLLSLSIHIIISIIIQVIMKKRKMEIKSERERERERERESKCDKMTDKMKIYWNICIIVISHWSQYFNTIFYLFSNTFSICDFTKSNIFLGIVIII